MLAVRRHLWLDTSHMRFCEKLSARIRQTQSALCVGLDPRPSSGGTGKILDFLTQVIEETSGYAAAFKPNIAYFEAMGIPGLQILEQLLPKIPKDIPVVLDVKRGDIGETQKYYAQAYFDVLGVDAVTLNPFMGYDTLEPFLDYEGKGVYLLAVTSNPGSADIERQPLEDGRRVYELVGSMVSRAVRENRKTDVGMVVGLTNADAHIFDRLPDAPLLIPGLGAQGGDLGNLARAKRTSPPLINVSRGILYQDEQLSYGEKAAGYAANIRQSLGL